METGTLRLTYVLPEPVLGGGNKVSLLHAQTLHEAGHDVEVSAEGRRPAWSPFEGQWLNRAAGEHATGSRDLVIATFWPTVDIAVAMNAGPVAHFCQGYEGHLEHLAPVLPEIEAAYRRPLPKLVVSPHLADLLEERFGQEARLTPPILDPLFEPRRRLGPRHKPWIAVPGIFEAAVKRVDLALAAVKLLQSEGLSPRVLRFSSLPLSGAEAELLAPSRYLCDVPPTEVATALRRCDLLFLPSRADEGFGLPALEAMASGVPVVATGIPSVRSMADGAIAIVEQDSPRELAGAAHSLLSNGRLWRLARRRGLERADRFSARHVLAELEAAIAWAASDGGRT